MNLCTNEAFTTPHPSELASIWFWFVTDVRCCRQDELRRNHSVIKSGMLSHWSAKGSGMGFIIEYVLPHHSHQHCICETQNNKTQVPCCLLPFGWGSRGTGFIMEYAFVCGGSAGELCLSCTAPIVIETSVMNKTCDPVSIRVQGFDPEFRVPGLVFVAGGGGHFKLLRVGRPRHHNEDCVD